MSGNSSKMIQWKKVYQLISGTFYNENPEVVKKRLLELENEIKDGLKIFKKPKNDANEEVEKLLKEKQQEKLISFAQKLYKFLDLDVGQSYELLCYYLVNEYRGSAASLQNFVSNESLMIKLLNDIFFYYTLERMVMLKVVKCILENHESKNHPYRQAFKVIVKKIGMSKIRTSFIDQFEMVLKDVHHSKYLTGDIFNSQQKLQCWSERKHRELNEILQIIMISTYYEKMKPDEIQRMLDLFKHHSFGKQNQFLNTANSIHMDLIQRVNYNEIAVLMIALSLNNVDSNTAWTNEVIDKLDGKIISMHHYQEHGPILLSWMIYKFASKGQDTALNENFENYGKLGARAVQLNVFDYLLKMLMHKQFKDKSLASKIITRCVYDNIIFLCKLFNSDGSMANHPHIYEVFSEVLKTPAIAKDFCKDEESVIRTLFNSAIEMFPVNFVPLSMLAKSLSNASILSNSWILNLLENLPVYAEQPNDPYYELRKSDDDQEEMYILQNDYQPFRKIPDFVIPTNTQAIVREEKGKMFVHFLTKLNYFHALHNEINELLNCVVSFSEIQDSKLQRLEAGINLLAALITRLDKPDDITNEMIHPTEMIFDILEKFKIFQSPSLGIMAACLNVCAELVIFFGEEIIRRFINLNIAPTVNAVHYDFQAYCNGNSYESGIVGFYLINIERSLGRYDFTKAYLNFLKKCTKLEVGNIHAIELPGLLFIIREVFNNVHSWCYENEQDRMEILLFIFEYIHCILTLPNEVIKDDPSKRLLRDVCVYSLLYLDNGSTLLRYVAIGNPGLNNFMENESNWFTASESDLNKLVLNAIRILMQTLRLKETITKNNDILTPLEQMIYTQPKQRDTLKIIPIVANYTTYSFNRRFPVLSCRLLRRFAIEFQSSLSACLDLEPDQIRMMFLQRLRDDLESEDLKVSILDFVNACIDKQPGLTEAFFKVSYEKDMKSSFFIKRSSEDESTCDGIISYMEEFLEAVSKDPSKITNDQLKRIMNLFHGLWKQGLQSLVSSLLKKNTFWSSLCSPILATPIENYQYSQLINIIGIELFKLREVNADNENFRKVVEKFLSPDIFKKWLSVVFELPSSNNSFSSEEETPEWLSRLQSFKDFLVLLFKKKSVIKMPAECKKMLLDNSLKTLLHVSKDMENGNDSRPFIVLAELFMFAIQNQDLKYTKTNDEDSILLNQFQLLLKTTSNCYGSLHKRSKDAILAMAIKILDLESDEIKNHSDIANSIVMFSLEILSNEFYSIETHLKEIENVKTGTTSAILSINLLKKILLIGEEFYGNCNYWFNYYKVFNRILNVISLITQIPSQSKVTAELFDLLLLMAKGSYSKDIMYCEIGDYLWMNLLTPKSLVERTNTKSSDWTSQEWWLIYTKGIQLVNILLEKEKHLFIKEALFFVGIHEQYLSEAIALAKYSLDHNAMMLIKSTLELLSEIIKYEKFWSSEYQMTIQNLIRYVQCLLDHAVSLLYRPKLLKRLTESSKANIEEYSDAVLSDPSDDFIDATNGLIEVISLCCQCLLHFSPKLLNLLCDVEFNQAKWIPFIEVQFGAPKISGTPQLLSYGSILSIIALLIKTLNLQHFNFKQIPLNKIPEFGEYENEYGSETISMISVGDSTQQLGLPTSATSPSSKSRQPFSKSLSISSMTSSVIQPSNELLLHIDTKMCLNSLELLLTLLASQSLLALKARQLSSREKQMIRRELSTELYCFHDFVKKRILKDTTKSPLYRQKMGIFYIVNNAANNDDEDQGAGQSKAVPYQRRSHDLRVNVVRKLHLQQKTVPFEVPQSISPISIHHGSQTKEQNPADVTPLRSTTNLTTSTHVKRVGFDLNSTHVNKISVQEYDDEPYALNNGDPSFTGLSFIKFIEEDYLQLLSNIFIFICQNEN